MSTALRRRRVGATVEHHAALEVHERAVGVGVVPHPDARRVAVHVAEERLVTAVHHLHRTAGAQREQAHVHLQAHVLARAERAADTGELQAHRSSGSPRHSAIWSRSSCSHCVEMKSSTPAVAVGHRERRLGAHERLVLHADLVGALDDDVADDALGSALDAQVAEDVAVGVDRRPPRSARSGSVSGSSTSYSTTIASHARRAVSGWSAATAATAWPA